MPEPTSASAIRALTRSIERLSFGGPQDRFDAKMSFAEVGRGWLSEKPRSETPFDVNAAKGVLLLAKQVDAGELWRLFERSPEYAIGLNVLAGVVTINARARVHAPPSNTSTVLIDAGLFEAVDPVVTRAQTVARKLHHAASTYIKAGSDSSQRPQALAAIRDFEDVLNNDLAMLTAVLRFDLSPTIAVFAELVSLEPDFQSVAGTLSQAVSRADRLAVGSSGTAHEL